MTSQRNKLQEDTQFRVLRLLQENPELSQRELAAAVGVSVGGIHYVLDALIEKGLVKLGNFTAAEDKRRYAYVLTPKGIKEKALITGRFLKRKLAEYEALKAEIEMLQSEFVEIASKLKPGGRAVVRLPTPSSKAYEEYGANWVQLDAPRHLNLPSRNGMQQIVERAGLKILTSFDDSGDLQFYGSELFKKGIALSSPKARNEFTKDEMNVFRKKAEELNRQNRGDQVCYILSNN